jgi:CDP-4-dehydro-6-deoxyglucose reductase
MALALAGLQRISSLFTVTLKTSGRRFAVAPDETVLEAAQRAGVALPYSCRAGVCGSCKAILLEGQCDYPRNPPLALDAGALARHAVLTCQAVPRSDLLLEAREVTSVEDIARRQLDVVVTEKWRLADEVIGLRLLPAHGERPLKRLPGQYLDVLLDDGKRRPFSIANGPQADGMIELHVRHVLGGGFTSWVNDHLQVGDRLRIEGPLGTFVPREDSERPMIFMAGGTGFAPVKAVVEHFIALGTRRSMQLYWGARSEADLYLRTLAEYWARELPNLHFHAVVSDPAAPASDLRVGLVHDAVLADHPDLSGHDLYMGGPPAMVDVALPQLLAAGLPEDHLYYDSFEYAPDVLAQIIAGRAGIHDLPL